MTYCVGLYLKDGLVMLADTRTNAGVDHISTYRKLHIFEVPGDRVYMLATAGNLAVTQSVMNVLTEAMAPPKKADEDSAKKKDSKKKAKDKEPAVGNLLKAPSLFRAAQTIGAAIREVHRVDGPALEAHDAGFNIMCLFAGQIKGQPHGLYQIYAAGNFIEASEDTPFLQIGEHKYGKPILDRALSQDTDLKDGAKLALLSMNSTVRSNLSVGMPVDLAVYKAGSQTLAVRKRIARGDPYYDALSRQWSEALTAAYQEMPDADWLEV